MFYGIVCFGYSFEKVNVFEFGIVFWRKYEEEDFIFLFIVIGIINIY